MGKTNYSVARVVTYTKQSIEKAERHNERKNKVYSNMNVDLEQTKNNVYYKTCNTTYNERLKELVDTGKVSLRGLKDNAKVFDELVLDINSDYFEKHSGYDFAKKFYTEQKEIAITSFVDKVKKYTEIKELTPEISGVGIISISANEYDFEKEFQNMLKNKIKTA